MKSNFEEAKDIRIVQSKLGVAKKDIIQRKKESSNDITGKFNFSKLFTEKRLKRNVRMK